MHEDYKKSKQVLLAVLFANLAVALMKIVVGSIIRSASMTADGFHSLSDASSNIVGLVGIRLASKPKDEDHPYGHGKFETLCGLVISAMLFAVGIKTVAGAFDRFKNPVTPEITVASLAVLLLTLAANIAVSVLEYRAGKKYGSAVLVSDSLHTRSDIYVSVGVLATLAGVKLGLPSVIDPIASLVVAGFILHAAYKIFRENSDVLVDSSAVDSGTIKNIAMSFPEVKDAHEIKSRGGAGDIYVELHVLVDSELSVEQSHRLAHEIEDAVKAKISPSAQVNVHLEPFEAAK